MKRVIMSGVTGILLGTMLVAMPAQADVLEGETVAKTTVEGGELLISATDEINFGTLTLDGTASKTIKKPGEITVTDYRGSYVGWDVSLAKATVATWDDAMTIDISSVSNAVNTASQPFASQAKADSYELVQDKSFEATLNVPNSVKAATYSTTLKWTLTSGPEGN
ncbi:hypothetical protein ATZ33_13600 [Enterococcus silesiacus]|uniref:WxL domain-containing protein n=2 Tax=Enterococcus silesiacus TaxID=332949 RepID=A0ABN4JA04_9ENTE|nr:hypothetical protein [Enterococcus silesiacus]ALS02383.1 hypothetical protein ATZ33_13600 [Enterococcus silesiacus]